MSTHFRAVALIACVRKYFLLLPGLTPTYITEISPVALRGGIGVCNQLAVTSGIFLSQVLGLDVALGTESGWPWLLALGAVVPSALQVAMLPFMPESPSYLVVNKGDDEGGMAALCKLRKTREVRSVFTIWTLCWTGRSSIMLPTCFFLRPRSGGRVRVPGHEGHDGEGRQRGRGTRQRVASLGEGGKTATLISFILVTLAYAFCCTSRPSRSTAWR